MAFCFKRKESVSKAVRRLSRELVEDALKCLKEFGEGESIYFARKDVKKMRAVLRLVRTGLDKKEFRRVTKRLRKVGKLLAAPRDAHVAVKTVTNLTHHFQSQLAAGSLRHIRADLRKSFQDELKRFAKERGAKAAERGLRRVAKALDGLEVKGKGWKALGPGVKAAYARGKGAYQRAAKNPSAENFHAWRKRAKDLWYQVTLLHRVWPEQMDALAAELELLGDYLGDDHDLVMLRQAVEDQSAGEGHGSEIATLNGLIEERQHELQSAALELGARFYAENPSAFCSRLAGYWKVWRGEVKRPTSQATV